MKTDKNNDYPRNLTDDVWLLGNYFFNIFYVKGSKKSALIEVGISAIVDQVINQLESIDEKPDYLIITHPHSDHITGLDGLKKKYSNASVVTGNGAMDFISHPQAAKMLISEDHYMARVLSDKGLVSGHQPIEHLPMLDTSMVVHDGDEIDLGGQNLIFLNLKGHSPGNIGVFLPRNNVLIASDSLGFHYPERGFMPLFFTGFNDYLNTIDRLSSLNSEILGLGHQGPITGPDIRSALQKSKEMTLTLHKKILSNSDSPEKISNALYNQFYKDELTLYSEKNILNCCKILVKRAMEI